MVSSSATGIYKGSSLGLDGCRIGAHGARESGDLLNRFAFHAQCDKQGRRLRGGGLAAHQNAHHVGSLILRQIASLQQMCDDTVNHGLAVEPDR